MSDIVHTDGDFAERAESGRSEYGPAVTQQQPRQLDRDLSTDIDLRDFLFMLWRRKALIALIVIVFLALGWMGLSFIKPRYTAEAMVKIQNMSDSKAAELTQLVANFKLDNTVILSEVEVIRSRSLARKVIQKYGLVSDRELNPLMDHLKSSSSNRQYRAETATGFKSLSLDGHKTEELQLKEMPPEVTDRLMGVIVNNFLMNVKVYPVTGSHVIQVEYTSSDPVKAARITNALIDSYLDQRLEEKFADSQKVTGWLEERLATLREQVRASEAAVEKYRNEKNLVVGSRAEITAQRLSELNTQLVVAKAKQAEARARLSQIEDARKNPLRLQSASEVLGSNLISQLKMREADLQRNLAELSERYGPKHPAIINARKEVSDVRLKIDEEIEAVLQGIGNEEEVAGARVEALEKELSEIEGVRSQENEDMIRLRELMRDAEANRLIYETFMETNKRSDDQEKLQEPEADIISYATVPAEPSYPNRPLFLSLTAAVALFFSIGICLLLEKFDNAFRSAGQLEAVTGLSCFALIPAIERIPQGELANYIISKPASNLAEAVRTLRTVLRLRGNSAGNSGEDARPRVVSVTSSFPGEGKSTLSAWLARISAKSGERVLLIDGDLRRPSVHKLIGARGDKTIVEYLTGQAKLDQIIEKDSVTGLHMIYARSVPNSALDLIESKRMKNLLESLRKAYDLIIIDTPACLAVSDARVLATLSDQTLYCVHWDKTAREIVTTGVKQFTDMGYQTMSTVLTNVDVHKHAKYGYGDTPYYYKQYKEYYQN
ncbi:MAG: polysaccharide biosynthesis tyrosine autokinase [Rhodospirillales bacterium]|nr:polysaccharide biosynthesis tyrosine autokinase [Rhodospirillales bacterium]MCB9965621.1 polysaccharide biosynthesis tyrosine autokinase [Rhodospirillales bacterium]MCB9973044.1 polysaccharide biosynthesis tyrosine autokinase [Rhodospirillales bacterium]